MQRSQREGGFSFKPALAWFHELNSHEWLEDIFQFSVIKSNPANAVQGAPRFNPKES